MDGLNESTAVADDAAETSTRSIVDGAETMMVGSDGAMASTSGSEVSRETPTRMPDEAGTAGTLDSSHA